MGVMTAGVGVGVKLPETWPLLLPALTLYAVHHGLAKGALFLSVGLGGRLSDDGAGRLLLWAAVVLPALALAGLPLTSGALAKGALKSVVADLSWMKSALSLSAIATTCLMARFVDLMSEQSGQNRLGATGVAAFSSMSAFILFLLPMLPQSEPFSGILYSLSSLWSASWPIAAGVTLYMLARSWIRRVQPLPAGDFIVVIEAGTRSFLSRWSRLSRHLEQGYLQWSAMTTRNPALQPEQLLAGSGSRLRVQPGVLFIAITLALAILLLIK
jgi:multicomponent Na+:H+ antiporter subunit D